MHLLPILWMNEQVDIAKGAKLRRRIQLAEIIALHRHMGDAMRRKTCRQGLEVHAAVEIRCNRAVQQPIELAADIWVVKELPAFVFIRQNRQEILLCRRPPQMRDIPKPVRFRRGILYEAV